jgi:hypothetical protein
VEENLIRPNRPPDYVDEWEFWFDEKITYSPLEENFYKIRFINKKFEWLGYTAWLTVPGETEEMVYQAYKKWLISQELKKRLK